VVWPCGETAGRAGMDVVLRCKSGGKLQGSTAASLLRLWSCPLVNWRRPGFWDEFRRSGWRRFGLEFSWALGFGRCAAGDSRVQKRRRACPAAATLSPPPGPGSIPERGGAVRVEVAINKFPWVGAMCFPGTPHSGSAHWQPGTPIYWTERILEKGAPGCGRSSSFTFCSISPNQ